MANPTLQLRFSPGTTASIYDGETLISEVSADSRGFLNAELPAEYDNGQLLRIVVEQPGQSATTVYRNAPDLRGPELLEYNLAADGTTFTGTVDDNTTFIRAYDEFGTQVISAFVNPDGTFTAQLTKPFLKGETLNLVLTDGRLNTNSIDIQTDDLTAPDKPTAEIDPETGDNISGTAEPGSTVTVYDEDGNVIAEGEADENGNYELPLTPPLKDLETVEVNATDSSGNTSDNTEAQAPDLTPPNIDQVVLTVDDITADNVLNIEESQQDSIAITGTITGVEAGDSAVVHVNVNGRDYEVSLNDGATTWSINVDPSDLIQDPDSVLQATATLTDNANNSISLDEVDHAYSVDVDVSNGSELTLSINNVTDNNILDINEAKLDTTTITGQTIGLQGDESAEVSIELNGTTYSTTSTDNGKTWTANVNTSDLLADESQTVHATAVVTDTAGNVGNVDPASKFYDIDLGVTPAEEITFGINDVTTDNILSAAELNAEEITVSGVIEGLADDESATVTVVVNDQTYTANVAPGQDTWSVQVLATDLEADADSKVEATALIQNSFGTTGEATPTDKSYQVDNTAEVGQLVLNDFDDTGASDSDLISSDNNFTLGLSDVEDGSTVQYQRLIQEAGGEQWITTNDSQPNLDDGSYTYRAVVTDSVGNVATTEPLTVLIDTQLDAGNISLVGFEDSGISSTDLLTNDDAYTIKVDSIEENAQVVIQTTKNGGEWTTLHTETTATDNATVEFEHQFADNGSDDGVYSYRAVVTDNAGNEKTLDLQSAITIDRTAPSVVYQANMEMRNSTFDSVILGEAEANTNIKVYTNDTGEDTLGSSIYLGEVNTDDQGKFTLDLKQSYPIVNSAFFVFDITDAAGNTTLDVYDRIENGYTFRDKAFVLRNDSEWFEGVVSTRPDNYDNFSVKLSLLNRSGLSMEDVTLKVDDYGRFKIQQDLIDEVNGNDVARVKVQLVDENDGYVYSSSSYLPGEHSSFYPTINTTAANDTFSYQRGIFKYNLLDSNDETGGNGVDTFTNFTVSANGETYNKIDISDLFAGQNVAEGNNLSDYLSVRYEDNNSILEIDRDGSANNFDKTDLIQFNNSEATLQDLILNNQVWYY